MITEQKLWTTDAEFLEIDAYFFWLLTVHILKNRKNVEDMLKFKIYVNILKKYIFRCFNPNIIHIYIMLH